MKSFSKLKGQALKRATLGLLIAVWALVFSGCEDLTNGNGGLAEQAALSASRVSVGQTPIYTQQDLADIELAPTDNYVLANDLTLTGWTPICGPYTGVVPFSGKLNGAGYTITIDSYDTGALASSDYLGIFAETSGATINNLTVNLAAGIVNTAAQYVGGLVGHATGTAFDTITVNGSLDVVSSNVAATVTNGFNVGLVAGYAEAGTGFGNITIAANLKVVYTNEKAAYMNAGGVVGYLVGSRVGNVSVDGQFTANADMPPDPTYVEDNGLRLGGVAGYAEESGFNEVTIDTSTAVNASTIVYAISLQTYAQVGGAVGRGLNVNINNTASSANIIGNGYGYNTSAGGVAGYIQQSTVTDASASSNITLSAAWDGTVNTLWQIYAGGLVGYSGGRDGTSSGGGSVIETSYATGAVSATSPYPYAGGLVGYNYGYNDFTGTPAEYAKFIAAGGVTVTYSGSRITQSYATGNVQATATANGLPYAGGLAGYSSIPTATTDPAPNIENCYATGDATVTTNSEYGWAGGLIGANAQGSVVSKCYATGNVSVTVGSNPLPYDQPGANPGAAGGGIAGVNYYIDATSKIPPLVTRSVALNERITGTVTSGLTPYLLHRVVGDLGAPNTYGLGILDDNYGKRDMVISPVWIPDIGPNELDGESIGEGPAAFDGWDFGAIWVIGADGYPVLR
ncbi:MAG: hypothetical protein LBD86_05275 [Spirochaetaceae bacterium]|jgi:hypothetical protein|nr:hypothetical protein [Spirochaetaceae bacterium]